MTSYSVDAPFYSSEHGEFVSSKAARLQEVLRDYNPYLELVFIPRAQRAEDDTRPFAIRDSSPAHAPYIVRFFTEREIDDPASVLAWLFEGDLSKHSAVDVLKRQQLKQDAERLLDLRRDEEIRQERMELAEALVVGGRDKKHYFKHNGKTFRR